MGKKKDNQAPDALLLSDENGAISFAPDDRNKDVAFLAFMDRLSWPILIIMVFVLLAALFFPTNLTNVAIPCSLVLMGCWILWFFASATRTAITKWHISTYILLVVFTAMSYDPWSSIWQVRAAVAFVIALMQSGLLIWMYRTCPTPETQLQNAFFGTLKTVTSIATAASVASMAKSFLDLPSLGSLACAMTCFLCFAYGVLVASLVSGPRGKRPNAAVLSCDAILKYENERHDHSCTGCLPILTNMFVALWFVILWPPIDDASLVSTTIGALATLCLMGAEALNYERKRFAAYRFHILPNASIVVETISKSYVYDQVVRAEIQPADELIPKQTDTCHVYCANSTLTRVVVQLAGERFLYLTPVNPAEFLSAINRAIKHPFESV